MVGINQQGDCWMTNLERELQVFDALSNAVERSCREYDITYAQMFGILKMVEHDLMKAWQDQEE